MSTIADLLIKVSADTGGAEKEISSFSSKVGGGFRKALVPAIGVLGGLGIAAKHAADDASNLNESANAVQVVFGKSSKTISDFARVADKEAGLSMRQLNELVTPVGASLKNYGFSAQEAADNSVMLAKRAADMASVFNTDVPTAMEAIQAGLRGEADPLEKFGVGLSAAAVQAKALSMGLGKTTVDMGKVKDAQLRVTIAQDKYTAAVGEHGKTSNEARQATLTLHSAQTGLEKAMAGGTTQLDANAMMQARLALLMGQTNMLQGDFVRTSGGAANAARINAAAQENLSATMGKGLLPVVQMYQSVLNSVLTLLGNHTTATTAAIGVVAALAAAVVVVNAAMKVYAASAAIVKAATAAWTAAQWLLNAALTANPVGIIILALVAFGAALVVLWTKSQTFRTIVLETWEKIKTGAQAAFRVIQEVITKVAAVAQAIWEKLGGTLTAITKTAFGVVVGIIRAHIAVIGAIFGAIGDVIHGRWGKIWDDVKTLVSKALNKVVSLITSIGQAVYNAAKAVGQKIVDGALDGIAGLGDAIKHKAEGLIHGALSSLNPFSPVEHGGQIYIGEKIVAGAVAGVGSLGDELTKALNTQVKSGAQRAAIAADIREASKSIGIAQAQAVVAGFVQTQPTMEQQIKAGLAQAVQNAKQAVTDAKAQFASAFSSLAQSALQAFDEKWSKWVPPAQTLLAKMQVQDQVAAAKQAIANAMATLANDKSAAAAAAAAVASATQNEGESAEDFAARLATLQQQAAQAQAQVVQDEASLSAAKRQQVELNLQLEATQQAAAQAKRIAKQRENLAQQLLTLRTELAKHPQEYDKVQKKVMTLLGKYDIKLYEAGQKFASQLADGLRSQIANVESAAQSLAKAVAKYLVTHSPAEAGPLSEASPFDLGARIGKGFNLGLAKSLYSGQGLAAPTLNVPTISASPQGTAQTAGAPARGGAQVVIENMEVRNETDVRLVARDLAMRLGV